MDIKAHVSRNPSDSGYVSTSKTMAAAKSFAQDHGLDEDAYYYTMRADGIDVNETLGSDSPFPWEEEIAVPLGIPMSDIISAEGPQGEAEDLAGDGGLLGGGE